MKIYSSAAELIGRTPLIRLSNIEKEIDSKANIIAKAELFNPAGSAKDRVALAMIRDAKEKGILCKDSVIIEPTSGNTGIGLASVGAAKGYRVIIVMPDSMSVERRQLMSAFGAELVLTPGSEGMSGAIAKAEELKKEFPNAIIAGQFTNPANPQAHYLTTGPEIFEDTDGNVDIFVAGVGTGGTVSGVGKFLKEKNPDVEIVAVEPKDSPLLTENKAGPHKIQGIGANFVPEVLDTEVIDKIMTVSTEEAYNFGKMMGKKEGLLVGVSSGAALAVAARLATDEANKGKNIVVFLPDTGERYLSTPNYLS